MDPAAKAGIMLNQKKETPGDDLKETALHGP
jgi:hypothetical protein